jgi:hypothetical protein
MKLTLAEQKIIQYPPTRRTYVCRGKRGTNVQNDDGSWTKNMTVCGFVNNGRNKTCLLCGRRKPEKPTLLWPTYLAALAKAGLELPTQEGTT